jgi:uncharacterized protein
MTLKRKAKIKRKWLFKLVGIAAIAILLIYLSVCGFLSVRQNHFIFFPSPAITSTPSEYGLKFEDVYLDLGNSQQVHGWWIPNSTNKTLLYLHGNGANISANIEHARRFYRLGFSILLIDYRGYGKSKGDFPTEASVYQDSEAAWKYLVNFKKIPGASIVIYGHSLGGAIAIDLAAKHSADDFQKHSQSAGLIVESSFTSIADMVKLSPSFRILPIDWLLNQRFDSISKVRLLSLPVLFLHGKKDSTIPFQMSEKNYAATNSQVKRIFLVANAGHNNNAVMGGDRYLEILREFIKLTKALNPSR